ncbi:MAG: hypothetical protein WCD16_11150, partial [Paracoccaceae bacterium]
NKDRTGAPSRQIIKTRRLGRLVIHGSSIARAGIIGKWRIGFLGVVYALAGSSISTIFHQ